MRLHITVHIKGIKSTVKTYQTQL